MKPIFHAILITAFSTVLLIVLRTYNVEKQLDIVLPFIVCTGLVSIVMLACFAAKVMHDVALMKSPYNRIIRKKA